MRADLPAVPCRVVPPLSPPASTLPPVPLLPRPSPPRGAALCPADPHPCICREPCTSLPPCIFHSSPPRPSPSTATAQNQQATAPFRFTARLSQNSCPLSMHDSTPCARLDKCLSPTKALPPFPVPGRPAPDPLPSVPSLPLPSHPSPPHLHAPSPAMHAHVYTRTTHHAPTHTHLGAHAAPPSPPASFSRQFCRPAPFRCPQPPHSTPLPAPCALCCTPAPPCRITVSMHGVAAGFARLGGVQETNRHADACLRCAPSVAARLDTNVSGGDSGLCRTAKHSRRLSMQVWSAMQGAGRFGE